VTLYKNRRQ